MEQDQTAFEVTDGRRRGWFHLDNALIDDYAKRIGTGGLALYMTLARHANGSATAYPSLRRLQALLNVSKHTILKYLAVLEKEQLISRQSRLSIEGDATSTLYTLLPLPPDGGGANFAPPGAEIEPGGAEIEPGVVQNLHYGSAEFAPEGRETSNKTQGKEKDSPISIVSFPSPAAEVLDHLIMVSGRPFRTPGRIPSALTQGYRMDELLLVIDWWGAVKTVEDPDQRKYFDNETPFRPTKIDKYHAAAVVWDREGRPAALRPGVMQPRNAQAVQALVKDVHHDGRQRLPALFRRSQLARRGLGGHRDGA